MIKLKKCPFCGGTAGFEKTKFFLPKTRVACPLCQATSDFFSEEDDAAEAWNARIPTLTEEQLYAITVAKAAIDCKLSTFVHCPSCPLAKEDQWGKYKCDQEELLFVMPIIDKLMEEQ